MIAIILSLSFVAAIANKSLLSMLLFLVLAYVMSAMWFIKQSLIYAALLYVLVYIGAIVVLFIFVIQLTSTDITAAIKEKGRGTNVLVSVILLTIALIAVNNTAYSTLLVLMQMSSATSQASELVPLVEATTSEWSLITQYDLNPNINNINLLAHSLFNNYAYVLVLTAHAIILAIIGPIKLALAHSNIN